MVPGAGDNIMAILNYSTKITASKTVGEIQEILTRNGANSVTVENVNRKPYAVVFSISHNKINLIFRLPCNTEGVLAAMRRSRQIPQNYKNVDQAERTGWRIIKDWILAQCAIIEAGQAVMAEVFMPYACDKEGRTVFQEFINSKQLHLKE